MMVKGESPQVAKPFRLVDYDENYPDLSLKGTG
jgi:hypothetical protein